MLAFLVVAAQSLELYDDFHYPDEESSERAGLNPLPRVTGAAEDGSWVELLDPRSNAPAGQVRPGDEWAGYQVLSIIPSDDAGCSGKWKVVLERLFARWGALVLASQPCGAAAARPPVLLRKSIGDLASIRQPYFNFSAEFPGYFDDVASSLSDLPLDKASTLLAAGADMSYAAAASVLSPQRDIAALGNAKAVIKFVLTHNGRVKCAVRLQDAEQTEGGITEFQDATVPAPNPQKIVFDPADSLAYWPRRFENAKAGLVGGYINIGNVGGYSSQGGTDKAGSGYEVVAFSPEKGEVPLTATAPAPACNFTGPLANSYVKGYPPSTGLQSFPNLSAAEAACSAALDCGGITLRGGRYELRQDAFSMPSPTGETSWLVVNASKALCHVQPRIPGLDYAPGVFVRLRAQSGPSWNASNISYMWVSNTTQREVSPKDFYAALFEHAGAQHAVLGSGSDSPLATLSLPGREGRRQMDMIKSGMLSSINNYIGNQSNYGFGGTYWSYGREDNGSLPLNWLSVDVALLEWGECGIATSHMGFYFDNYMDAESADIDFYTWGDRGDSVGDLGRIASAYVKAAHFCAPEWADSYMDYANAMAAKMIKLRDAAKQAKPSACCTGLVVGPPEHDWFGTTDKFFYNNNVWLIRGMEELGMYLRDAGGRANTTLSAALLADAPGFRRDVAYSLGNCTVRAAGGDAMFLPPYAETSAKPYKSMTESNEASYSNFRFFSEALLADLLPAEIGRLWLDYHNARGGRVGGASRWSTHLDDMPTAGWGYAALAHNKTDDFLSLLYGHAANYQSRGTFHSTEQLSFLGEGLYRQFLHWPNDVLPDPYDPPTSDMAAAAGPVGANLGNYYQNEQDISFCIVSQVLVSRLSLWQLVFEDLYRPSMDQSSCGYSPRVWLGRGAPRRWFDADQGGFSVQNVPTLAGSISFNATVPEAGHARYAVRWEPTNYPLGIGGSQLDFSLRWPGAVADVTCSKTCRVVAVDADEGFVTVAPVVGFSGVGNSGGGDVEFIVEANFA